MNIYRLLVLLMLTGCVSKKKYNLALEKLDAERQRSSRLTDDLEATRSERAALESDREDLQGTLAEQERALLLLQQREAQAQERIQAYRDFVARFQEMIDAGQLSVRMVEGRMVVQMETDILFPPGKSDLSPEGVEAISRVAGILASIPDRKYQIEGHTDNVPIKNAVYPSNWELAADRAIAVVKTLIDSGLSAQRVSAASYAEYKPVIENSSKENRAKNRRIEIVVVPDLSSMPGSEAFDDMSN